MLLILDSQPIFSTALARVARSVKRGLSVEITSDPKVFRQKLIQATSAIVDVDAAGYQDLSSLPTLAVGVGAEHTVGAATVRAGARGYLCRCKATEDDFRIALLHLLNNRSAVTQDVNDGLLQVRASYKFSGRELEVAKGLLDGLNGNEIAGRLHVSRSTVQTYEERLHSKLNTSSRPELLEQLRVALMIDSHRN